MAKPWQIWIDTGGTFTDCIAIDPQGKTSRLKVLSNSVLRGRVIRQSGNVLYVDMIWPAQHDIFAGYTAKILTPNPIIQKIESVDLKTSAIRFKNTLRQKLVGYTIEISSGEEVPMLTARLATHTKLK